MDMPTLSDQERRWYWELFRCLDVDGREQLSGANIFDMFLTSGLQPEIVHKIVDLCGAKRLGHFGRIEFFIALKLIAAAQNGYMPVLDICGSGIELPVPRFALAQINPDPRLGQALTHSAFSQPIPAEPHFMYYDRNGVPVLPSAVTVPQLEQSAPIRIFQPSRSLSLVISGDGQPLHVQDHGSPPVVSHERVDVGGVRKSSVPAVHHVHPASVISVASVDERKTDKGWAMFEEDGQGLINADCKSWTQFVDTSKADTSSMSSESVDDVWCITDEQREYYMRQFKLMQDDVRGVISGAVAKEFFEKSKLPVHELSKIWQLSDVNRDGALSLDEFCTAMHLVVLRRNDIELPETLPPVLQPYAPLIDEPFTAETPGSTLRKLSPTPSTSSQPWTTAFQLPESPTSSSVSSPGNKPTPVNFEFRPITADSDSKIIHPLAVRLSPESQPFPADAMTSSGFSDGSIFNGVEVNSSATGPGTTIDMLASPPTAPVLTDILIDLGPGDQPYTPGTNLVGLHRPRPTPKKAQSLPGPTQDMLTHVILPPPPPSQDSFISGDRTVSDNAPLPPPRGSMASHSRSTSLDNQLIDFSEIGSNARKVKFPPVVPPRSSPKDMASSPESSGPDRPSSCNDSEAAFNSRRNRSKLNSLERNDLKAKIKRQKERNLVLSRLNSELNQELQEVMEQHIALEIQMEHLRSFYS